MRSASVRIWIAVAVGICSVLFVCSCSQRQSARGSSDQRMAGSAKGVAFELTPGNVGHAASLRITYGARTGPVRSLLMLGGVDIAVFCRVGNTQAYTEASTTPVPWRKRTAVIEGLLVDTSQPKVVCGFRTVTLPSRVLLSARMRAV